MADAWQGPKHATEKYIYEKLLILIALVWLFPVFFVFVKYEPCCENRSSAFTFLVNFAVSVVINNTSDRHNEKQPISQTFQGLASTIEFQLEASKPKRKMLSTLLKIMPKPFSNYKVYLLMVSECCVWFNKFCRCQHKKNGSFIHSKKSKQQQQQEAMSRDSCSEAKAENRAAFIYQRFWLYW